MSAVRIFIADDEAPARERRKELLSDIAAELPTEVVGEARHGLEAVERVPASGAPPRCARAAAARRLRHRARPACHRGLRAERARLSAQAGARPATRGRAEESCGCRRPGARDRKSTRLNS